MTDKRTFADRIDAGLQQPGFFEDKGSFALADDLASCEPVFLGCALFAGLIGTVGTPAEAYRLFYKDAIISPVYRMACLCGISPDLATYVNHAHRDGIPAAEIARRLREKASAEEQPASVTNELVPA